MKAVIVTGDRHADDTDEYSEIWSDVIRESLYQSSPDVVIHGDAHGIDALADSLALNQDMAVIPMPAQWKHHGNSAGPRRNRHMLEVLGNLFNCGYEVSVLAFHDDLAASKGTAHMVKIARTAGVPVTIYHSDGTKEQLA